MVDLLNVPNALAQGFTNWGQQAGQNIVASRERQRALEQQNLLAQAIPALMGDPSSPEFQNALQTAGRVSPTVAFQAAAAGEGRRDKLDEKFQFDLAGRIAQIAMLPAEQQDAAWASSEQDLAKTYPHKWDGTPDPWNVAKQQAFGLAAKDKNARALFVSAGLLPAAPGDDSTPSNLQEWAAFQKMTPTQQQQFLTMKRADRVMDTGGAITRFSQMPGGAPVVEAYKTPPPEQMPGFKAAQTVATEGAKADVERDTAAQVRERDAGDSITLLQEAQELLGQGPTGSGAGALADKALGVVGKSTKGGQLASRLGVIGGYLTSKVPKMSGPQSNLDVENYKVMAGKVGDSSVPVDQRLAAVATMLKLQQKYASQNPPEGAAAPTGRKPLSSFNR